ncbi:LrgB family protein [Neobacillus notoginsengisoli]|uniref:LrgB family protein n=1 Tax=Neobacillus notoginsengisoli TaxID=1578198 RepID=A0A417YW56_9BACI|nr:LrgB family protein [Neobacillus notoginsengisoli]RHW41653.1 LrgB family protein [Neobacillus notoginsengisoli]
MSGITLFSIILTIAAYIGAVHLARKISTPLTTPVLVATIVIIFILSSMKIDYSQYTPAKEWMTFLLGPATVALALPLYKTRKILMEKFKSAVLGLSIGTITTIITAVGLSKALGLSEKMQAASAVKAVTSPVAIEAVLLIGGSPATAVAFVMGAGILGAVFGPIILTVMKISDPFARGLGIGTVAHGIGTSQIMKEGSLQGAASSAAMGIAAIITSLILPWIYPLFN